MDLALGVLGLGLVVAIVWAIVLCVRKSWLRARSVAAWTFWVSLAVQLLAWFGIPIAVVSYAANRAPEGGASSKARVLAENISEGMNCTAPLILVTPAAVAVWLIAVWRARKGRGGHTPASR
jgi:hypothetical protein